MGGSVSISGGNATSTDGADGGDGGALVLAGGHSMGKANTDSGGVGGSRGGAVGGSVELISGKSNDFKSGDISIRTTDEAEAGLTGRIDIRSGRVQHGVSGDVEIATGPSSGNGVAGGITLRAGHGYQHEGADVTIAAGNITAPSSTNGGTHGTHRRRSWTESPGDGGTAYLQGGYAYEGEGGGVKPT